MDLSPMELTASFIALVRSHIKKSERAAFLPARCPLRSHPGDGFQARPLHIPLSHFSFPRPLSLATLPVRCLSDVQYLPLCSALLSLSLSLSRQSIALSQLSSPPSDPAGTRREMGRAPSAPSPARRRPPSKTSAAAAAAAPARRRHRSRHRPPLPRPRRSRTLPAGLSASPSSRRAFPSGATWREGAVAPGGLLGRPGGQEARGETRAQGASSDAKETRPGKKGDNKVSTCAVA